MLAKASLNIRNWRKPQNRYQWVIVILLLLLVLLQGSLWLSRASVIRWLLLEVKTHQQSSANQMLINHNQKLYQIVLALRHNKQAIESIARSQLAMIKEGEMYYYVVQKSTPSQLITKANPVDYTNVLEADPVGFINALPPGQ